MLTINGRAEPLANSTVGDTPTLVLADVGRDRVDAIIQNVGPSAVRLGAAGVSYDDPASGYLLPPPAEGGAPPEVPWPYGGPLYAVCPAGEATVLSGWDVR